MTFDELLDQIVELLQRRGRVTYRALKRRFDLDDAYLEDLKGEILFAHPQAKDEDGQGLVWMGDTEAIPKAPPPTLQPRQTPNIEETASARAELSPSELHSPDAERRQLTVMFCDLVDSTVLSAQLDPEDLRDVIQAYQKTAAGVIQRYEGHIAQYLGDGLLVYFGWPQAHEDDAQRGVHAGLGIVEAITTTLNPRLDKDIGVRLAVRIGMHTGPVVIGEIGGGGRHERLALGETTNIASRLEGLAQPNTVVISDTTCRLVAGYFACDDRGLHGLKGVATPVQTYQALQATGVQGRLDVAISHGLTPLVGRESEVSLLLERWQQVQDGQGQVILLSGEAGIGKSRLVQVLKDHVAEEPHTQLDCRSSPYYQNTALYPITDLLQRTLQWQQGDTPEEKLVKLEQMLGRYRFPLVETVPLFAALLSLPIPGDRYPPLALSPQQQRQKTLESIVGMLLELSESQPMLFILEDLHWIDPSTLELLGLLIEQVPTASVCVLLICRPEYQPSWIHRSYLTEITVNRLSHHQVEQMATHVASGKTLPPEVIAQLMERTDGVPLYVEEMTKALLESGHLKAVDGHYELTGTLPALAIPATLHDSLMARLDRLVTAKGIVQLGATIGRQFSYALLHATSQLDEPILQRELGRLGAAELVYQRGVPPQATYTFKHALIQEAAYQSLLKRTRQQYHQQIAQVLEAQFPETAETQPELLAHHYTEAGQNDAAIGYWQRAGQHAIQNSAHMEAINHLRQGLAVLRTLPDTPERLQQELDLQVALGPALIATQGNAALEVEHAYARARELCQQVGNTPQLFPVLRGLMLYYANRGDLETAYQLGEQLLRLAHSQPDPAPRMLAHYMMGMAFLTGGEPALAQSHHTQALAIYIPLAHRALALRYAFDLAVGSHTFLAWDFWFLGYPDRAIQHSQTALTWAHEVIHPPSLAHALYFTSALHQFRREAPATQAQAAVLMTLATEQGFALRLAQGTVIHGWALAMQGQVEAGIAQMRQGLSAARTTGDNVYVLYFLGLLAEAYGKGGHPEAGLNALAEVASVMATSEARWYQAELYRLKGALLLKQVVANSSQAEACFHQALDIARQQQAKSWELRAATSLARLWQSQGKHQEAYGLLAPVYGWFTEGFDTADLQDAKTLLDELAR